MFTLDGAGRVTYINKAAEKMLAWSASQLHGQLIDDAIARRPSHLEGFAPEATPMLRARRDGVTVHVDVDFFVRRDGRSLPVAYTASPFIEMGKEIGCLVVFEDISERQARAVALAHQNEVVEWVDRCRTAIDEQRLLLYAQPIFDLHTMEVVQHELLLRVREPDGTVAAPGPYLDVAEQYNLIADIDRWVIARGAEIAAGMHPVQVNVSAASISSGRVVEHITRCIERAGADPADMAFEITETALIAGKHAAVEFAERLHELGCKVALDDFGTGFSGFSYLKHIPVDSLKLDIELVGDLTSNAASAHVVKAVVALARDFGAYTVAEGIEDPATLEMARGLGVGFGQGFYLARPEPLEDTPALDAVEARARQSDIRREDPDNAGR